MTDMETKIKEYREYKRMIEELETLASAIADKLKAAMAEVGKDKMIIGEYKLSYSDVQRRTLDQKYLEADLGDLSEYMSVTTYKRFSVA